MNDGQALENPELEHVETQNPEIYSGSVFSKPLEFTEFLKTRNTEFCFGYFAFGVVMCWAPQIAGFRATLQLGQRHLHWYVSMAKCRNNGKPKTAHTRGVELRALLISQMICSNWSNVDCILHS